MGKAPAFQFYVRDWLVDPNLQMCSHSTRGIWIDFLCYMWESDPRGKIVGTYDELKNMIGATKSDFDFFLTEAQRHRFCDISVTKNKNVTGCNEEITEEITIINRRMYSEQKIKESNRLRQQRFRDKKSVKQEINTEITPLSSSSSSSSVIDPEKSGFSQHKKSRHYADNLGDMLAQIKQCRDSLFSKHKIDKVDLWIQQKVNKNGHPKAILLCLQKTIKVIEGGGEIKSWYGYAEKIFKVENGNFNEKDAIEAHEKIKAMGIENPDILQICKYIFNDEKI